MSLTPEARYLQLGQLAANPPADLPGPGPLTAETNIWIARMTALAEPTLDAGEKLMLKTAAQGLEGLLRPSNAQTVLAILYRALARAELSAPPAAQGMFIPAGGLFDAFVAFGKVLSAAAENVLFVDPYAAGNALSDFAVQVPAGVAVRILTADTLHKPTLAPAVARWSLQYGGARPLETRLAPAKAMHDRLLIIDGQVVWSFGQSLNAIAVRAQTALIRVDEETGLLKVAAYEALWDTSTPI